MPYDVLGIQMMRAWLYTLINSRLGVLSFDFDLVWTSTYSGSVTASERCAITQYHQAQGQQLKVQFNGWRAVLQQCFLNWYTIDGPLW